MQSISSPVFGKKGGSSGFVILAMPRRKHFSLILTVPICFPFGMGWYITLLLAGGGAFSAFCAWRDYDRFFDSYQARPFVRLLGRKRARIFYIGLGIFLFIPGVMRIVHPPATFTAEQARYFTRPFGFGLLESGAGERIRTTGGVVGFREANGGWQEFTLVLKPDRFPTLRDPSSLFVDVDGGYTVTERVISGKPHTGVVMYFDASYRLCNNVIFSRTPLSSAELIVLVWDIATSSSLNCTDGLLASFHRRGSPTFEAVQKWLVRKRDQPTSELTHKAKRPQVFACGSQCCCRRDP